MKNFTRNCREHILTIFSFGTLAIILITLSVIGIWTFYPYKTIEFESAYKTDKTSYYQGEQTFYTVSYCKYTHVTPRLDKHFVDGIVFEALETKAVLDVGCKTVAVPLQIPKTLPPGEYHLEVILEYEVNPIRSIFITNQSNKFTVLRDDSGAYGPTPTELNLIKE